MVGTGALLSLWLTRRNAQPDDCAFSWTVLYCPSSVHHAQHNDPFYRSFVHGLATTFKRPFFCAFGSPNGIVSTFPSSNFVGETICSTLSWAELESFCRTQRFFCA